MRATDIFRKLMDKVYQQTIFTRRRKYPEVGALIKELSLEERRALKELKSDDLSEEKIIIEEAKLLVHDEYHERHRAEIDLHNEKIKFDKFIIK